MLLQPDVWVRLRASTADKMPGQLVDAVRCALMIYERIGLRVVCADSTDWAASVDTPLDWPRSASDEHVAFVIVGVVLNGPSIAQSLAADKPGALSLFEEAAAHLLKGGIAVNGMAFGRQEQMTSADDIRAWLSTLRRPHHDRANLYSRMLEQS
ncbi:hypothetical protein [Massilia soli]|uniref:DUF3168 domain-containing protein n=1 Tax=Massilia soli TaxID=2792854 RepID=A0ABS7SM83_9BURK|nr:hypothetical protein [Massilia soli]MBZ2207162.1 hypothetical protein [Massilia soli]